MKKFDFTIEICLGFQCNGSGDFDYTPVIPQGIIDLAMDA